MIWTAENVKDCACKDGNHYLVAVEYQSPIFGNVVNYGVITGQPGSIEDVNCYSSVTLDPTTGEVWSLWLGRLESFKLFKVTAEDYADYLNKNEPISPLFVFK